MAMRLSIRNEWNKITLPMPCQSTNPKGSEFPVVILPITRQSGRMLQRNLIYTAITRAKSKLVMLGKSQPLIMPFATKELNEILYLIQRFEQTYTQVVDKSVKRLLKTEDNRRHPIKQKRKTTTPQKPLKTKTFREISIHPRSC